MNSTELYTIFRNDVADDVEPYLWSDSEIYQYMNDAYYMFVRLTGGIPDYTSSVTNLVASSGKATTCLDPSIMRIRTATNNDTNDIIEVINAQDVDTLTTDDYGVLRRVDTTTTGKVRYLILGLEPEIVKWVPIPDRKYNIKLLVERLPLEAITGSGQEFEGVQIQHHFHFLKWMRHLAYMKQDADTINTVKAAQEAANFYGYCEQARKEKAQARHKVRVVSYGGL